MRRRSIVWRLATARTESRSGRRSSRAPRPCGAPTRRSKRCSTGDGPRSSRRPARPARQLLRHNRAVGDKAGAALCRPCRAGQGAEAHLPARAADAAGGGAQSAAASGSRADPYLTALCYFNALRELGGARRIVEDEVRAQARQLRRRAPRAPRRHDQPFANRRLREVLELTSRESTDKVAAAQGARSARPRRSESGVDVALATNMISVGLDISRLGLMVVQGQPKTAAEYIQATSRVGRRRDKPGLVLALLNVHKPRDRLHYEGFRHFHACFYRAVEATSVTPWAARALDRALAAVVVAAARHLIPALTPDGAAVDIVRLQERPGGHLENDPRPGARQRGRGRPCSARRRRQRPARCLGEDRRRQSAATPDACSTAIRASMRFLHDPLDPLLDALDPGFREVQGGPLDARRRAFVRAENHRSLRQRPELKRGCRWRTTQSD